MQHISSKPIHYSSTLNFESTLLLLHFYTYLGNGVACIYIMKGTLIQKFQKKQQKKVFVQFLILHRRIIRSHERLTVQAQLNYPFYVKTTWSLLFRAIQSCVLVVHNYKATTMAHTSLANSLKSHNTPHSSIGDHSTDLAQKAGNYALKRSNYLPNA